MNWPQLMRKSTVAAYIDTSPQSVDRWVEAGQLPKAKIINGVKRWDRDEIDKTWGRKVIRSADPDKILEGLRNGKDSPQAA